MRIENNTKYNTNDLKRLFLACCRAVGTGSRIRRTLTVDVIDWEHRVSRADYRGTWARINVSILERAAGKRELAWLCCHEFLHSRGISHRKMLYRYPYYHDWDDYQKEPSKMAWADEFTIREKTIKPKIEKDVQLCRYERTLSKIKEWTQKIKRHQNILRKYITRRRRYEKVLTAAGKLPKE